MHVDGPLVIDALSHVGAEARALEVAGYAGAYTFEGEHYQHTLMTPFFDPGPNPFGTPPIWLGGVGPRMIEVAGEVADGFMIHPFCTKRSLAEVTLPALARGRALQGAVAAPMQVSLPVMVATGGSDSTMAALVPDEMLHAMAIVAPPDEVADRIDDRYGTLIDRVALNTPYALDRDISQHIAQQIKGGSRRTR